MWIAEFCGERKREKSTGGGSLPLRRQSESFPSRLGLGGAGWSANLIPKLLIHPTIFITTRGLAFTAYL